MPDRANGAERSSTARPSREEMPNLDLFHADDDRVSFEDFAEENGRTYWWASDLAAMLGYGSMKTFEKTIQRAMSACLRLDINVLEHFRQHERDGVRDYKITRFACLLSVMTADTKKDQVNRAQVYFAAIADKLVEAAIETENVERIIKRGEISDHERSLMSTAKKHGVERGSGYARFQSAGYMGLYNMPLKQLRRLKGVPASRTPLDFMGSTELAANIFRLTMTDERIKNQNIRGQRNLENTAKAVGAHVRRSVEELSGKSPEFLAPHEDIKKVRSRLRNTDRDFEKLDGQRKQLPGHE